MTKNFSAMGQAFEYPATWRSGTRGDDVCSFTGLIVFLSTSALRDPCTVTRHYGRIAKVCGFPVRALPPGAVPAQWSDDGWPSWRLPRANVIIAGHKALETTTGGWVREPPRHHDDHGHDPANGGR
jgi:hypothetical protein